MSILIALLAAVFGFGDMSVAASTQDPPPDCEAETRKPIEEQDPRCNPNA